MLWLIDTFLPNFTIIRTFESDDKTTIYEYIYGSQRYYTDLWPPNTRHVGFPIKSVVRHDGIDVTNGVLKFSGPLRNYVHPLGASIIKKRISVSFRNFGLHVEVVDYIDKYSGTVSVKDIFDNLKIVHIE